MINRLWLELKSRLSIIIGLLLALIVIHIVNFVTHYSLSQYGVIPRSPSHIQNILFAPFIHNSWYHLINNLIGLAIFSGFCLLRSIRFYLTSSLFIIIFSGLFIWVFGRVASHAGTSGWIFGLWSLSIAMAWYDRKLKNIVIAFIVVLFYGGMVFGILPKSERISFEAHLFGAIAGIIWAWLYVKKVKRL